MLLLAVRFSSVRVIVYTEALMTLLLGLSLKSVPQAATDREYVPAPRPMSEKLVVVCSLRAVLPLYILYLVTKPPLVDGLLMLIVSPLRDMVGA